MESNKDILRINIAKMQDCFFAGCGYCKHQKVEPKLKYKNDLKITINSIPVNIYQNLMEKGWKRCGNRFYFGNYEKYCCKLYQPRLNINNFKISKEQKKVMKRFRKYLNGEYELNKINKINNINNTNKNNIKKEIKQEDEILNKLDEILKEYINSNNFLDILIQHIKKEENINFIYEKIILAKIKKNNNKKMECDYSCDLIFIIKNILINLNKKNKINDINNNTNINKNEINIISNNQNDEHKNFINEIYKDFNNFYKSFNINVILII